MKIFNGVRQHAAFNPRCIMFAMATWLIGSGVWGIAHPLPEPLEVTEISGVGMAPVPPSLASYFMEPQNILGGGEFRALMPTSVDPNRPNPSVTIQFKKPYRFASARHSNPNPTYRYLQISRAQIDWSDDGADWHPAASAEAFGGAMYFDLAAAGAHAWWRMTVTKSQTLPEVTIGNLWFQPAAQPFRIPYDVSWALACVGVLLAALALGRLTWPVTFTVVSAATVGFVFSYALLLTPFQVLSTPDAFDYVKPIVIGSYSGVRSVGYQIFVQAVHHTVGIKNIAQVQLLIQLLAFVILAWSLYRYYSPLLGIVTLVIGSMVACVWMAYYAPYILIESFSATAFMLVAAGVVSATRMPNWRTFLLLGGALALAMFAKTTAAAVAVAALLVVRFVPRGQRWRAAAFIGLPPLAIYLVMCAHLYAREGVFAPDAVAGLSIMAHICSLIGGDVPEDPGLVQKLQAAVAPSFADMRKPVTKISSLPDLNEYVDITTIRGDAVLWEKIVPALKAYNPKYDVQIDAPSLNRVLMRVTAASVRAAPFSYLEHVAAHFYGMWRQLGLAWTDLRGGAIGLRSIYYVHARHNVFVSLLGPSLSPGKVREAARQQGTIPLAHVALFDYVGRHLHGAVGPLQMWSAQRGYFALERSYVSIGLGIFSLLMCALIFVPGPLTTTFRTEIMLAYVLNAYMLGHALVALSFDRYPAVILPIAFVFVLCFLATTSAMCARAFRKGHDNCAVRPVRIAGPPG